MERVHDDDLNSLLYNAISKKFCRPFIELPTDSALEVEEDAAAVREALRDAGWVVVKKAKPWYLTDDQIRLFKQEAERGLAIYVEFSEKLTRARAAKEVDVSVTEDLADVVENAPCVDESHHYLAAKAEAGKGLLAVARHWEDCATFRIPSQPCDCGYGAALARWEAVENG